MRSLHLASRSLGNHYSESRNLLFNGDMFIDQANEGASVSLVSGTTSYIVDGWGVKLVQSSAVVTAQQVADAPPGFIDSLKITTGTGHSVGAGDYLVIKAPVEGLKSRFLGNGTANAAFVSLSFWVKSPIATETFSYSLQNSAGNRVLIGTFAVAHANLWEQFVIPAIPCDITGTWLNTNGLGMLLNIVLASGATQQSSTLNAWQGSAAFAANTQTNNTLITSANTFQLAGVQLEPGILVTPYSLIPYDMQLRECQRHLRKSFPGGTAPAQSAGVAGAITYRTPIATSESGMFVQFCPPMRAAPTITTYNPSAANANWRDITGSADVTATVDPASTISAGGVHIATAATSATIAHDLAIHYLADARLAI